MALLGKDNCCMKKGKYSESGKSNIEYREEQIGENIVQFINKAEMAETRIGEYKDNKFVISGVEWDNTELLYPITVMVDISKAIICNDQKFTNELGYNVLDCIDAYTNILGLSEVDRIKYKQAVKKFNSNKIQVMPIRPGTNIIIKENADGVRNRIEANIEKVRVVIDPQRNCTVGMLICKVSSKFDSAKSKKVLLEDYGSTWYIPRVEQGFDTKDIRYDVIKMTNLGLINPIEFVHKNNKIAIDGYAMYTIIDGIPTMIGKWEETSFEIYDHDSSLDALINKAMTALPFISAHRKYISPYLVSNTTVVNV